MKKTFNCPKCKEDSTFIGREVREINLYEVNLSTNRSVKIDQTDKKSISFYCLNCGKKIKNIEKTGILKNLSTEK